MKMKYKMLLLAIVMATSIFTMWVSADCDDICLPESDPCDKEEVVCSYCGELKEEATNGPRSYVCVYIEGWEFGCTDDGSTTCSDDYRVWYHTPIPFNPDDCWIVERDETKHITGTVNKCS